MNLSKILKLLGRSLKILLISLGALFLIALIVFLINLNSWSALVKSSLAAKQNLETGWQSLLNQDLVKAETESKMAKENFNQALLAVNKIEKNNPFFKLKTTKNQLTDLKKFITSGQLLAISFKQSTDFFININDSIRIVNRDKALSLEEKAMILEIALNSDSIINEIKDNLNLAVNKFQSVKNSLFLFPFKRQINLLAVRLDQGQILVNRSLPILPLLPTLGGWPEPSRFLILFQNNDELRPTGGFIGSYATLEIANLGQDIDMQTGDIYHLDKPSIEHLETIPPEPISKYMGLKKWYLRDANWSPDWPTAAHFIEWLFYQESYWAGLDFNDLDGIIAITPDLVADLIELTGPINLEGEIYTADNLQKLLQYQTGVGYREEDIAAWDRKDIINDLALILKDRLQNIKANQLPDIITILDKAIIRKDLLTYFTDPQNQLIAKKLKTDGQIKKTNSDYLMIVDANLAAFKTDAVVIKNWQYEIENTQPGLVAKLSLTYQHQGGFDWRTTRYRSYTRVLSPLGSQLLSIEEASDLKTEEDISLNKTIFGFFLSVEPGQTKTIKLSYLLPSKIKDQIENKEYELYLQRQPGSRINSFNFIYNNFILKKDLESDKVLRIFSE